MSQPQKKRIFATGASGYVGSAITEFAVAQGYAVHGLTRSASGEERLRKLGAVSVRGDLTSLDVIRQESAQADIVISLASACTPETPIYKDVLYIDTAALDTIADGLQGTITPLITTAGTFYAAADPNSNETTEESLLTLVVRMRTMRQAQLNVVYGLYLVVWHLIYTVGETAVFHFL